MYQINNHVILSHIDSPARILIWPANQVLTCSVPFAMGMITEQITAGVVLSIIASFAFKYFNKRFGRGKLRSILYWYLPTAKRLIKNGVPPSHVRYWIR